MKAVNDVRIVLVGEDEEDVTIWDGQLGIFSDGMHSEYYKALKKYAYVKDDEVRGLPDREFMKEYLSKHVPVFYGDGTVAIHEYYNEGSQLIVQEKAVAMVRLP